MAEVVAVRKLETGHRLPATGDSQKIERALPSSCCLLRVARSLLPRLRLLADRCPPTIARALGVVLTRT